MNFVLDASVTMGWLLPGGKPAGRGYALKVLDALKQARTGALSSSASARSNSLMRLPV